MYQRNKKITSYFIFFGLLLIGIVYAILQANLQINGTAKIKSNTWDIHFDNIQVNENSVSIGTGDSAATIDPNNNCKVDFEVTLSLPGDFYEFTVDVVNVGTIDGMIGTLNKTLKVNNEVVSEVPDYLIYTVMYSDGVEVEENHKLEAGTTETYLIRLEFSRNIEELPSATTIQTSLEPQYLQADNTSVVRPAATFIDGKSFNARIKKLAGNSSATYTDDDITITAFRKSSIPPDMNVMTEDNLVSSEGIIYAWFDNGTIYYYSSNPKPYLNEDSSYMFYQLIHISILEVDSVNTSNVTTMASMFYKAGYSVMSFSLDVSNWDTSHVTDMSHMFDNAGHDAISWNIGDLSNWDTRNVVTMSYMFCHAASFYNISWRDAGNLKIYYTDISHMFFQTSSANITLSLYDNPRSYSKAFYSTASQGKMIINYTSAVTNIDAIIASAEAGSVITKGELITE